MGDARTVKPYTEINRRWANAVKSYSDDFYLIPTIGISVTKQNLCSLLRYPAGSFCRALTISFKWLAWEWSVAICRKNYRWIEREPTQGEANE